MATTLHARPVCVPLVALGLGVLGAATASAQSPRVLADLNTIALVEPSSNPGSFCELGNTVLFAADAPLSGRELWRHDFTTGATALVADLRPGIAGSSPSQLVAGPGFVVFFADDGQSGFEPWRSDGTAAGTVRLRDIEPGLVGSFAREPVSVGSQVFFVATTSSAGQELWCTDGTVAGTRMVVDLWPGFRSSAPSGLTAFGNRVAFRAGDAAVGFEPWLSDGTPAGTTLVADLVAGPGGSFPTAFTTVGPWLTFGANGTMHRSDGTPAGTSGLGGPMPQLARSFGTTAVVATSTELWWIDGTPANTRFVATAAQAGEQITWLQVLGGRAVVQILSGSSTRLATVDAAGGIEVLQTVVGSGLVPAAVSGGHLWFAGTGTSGNELWRSDGTAAGTQVFLQRDPGDSAPQQLTALTNGRLVFSAVDPTWGREPWYSDGTLAGTAMLTDVGSNLGPTGNSQANGFVDAGGITYFAAAADGLYTTLWRTDGTPAGTWVVVPPGPSRPLGVTELVALGTRVFFVASHAQYGQEVWVSDGTASGTFVLFDVAPGVDGSGPNHITAATDHVFFTAFQPVTGRALWFSRGTPATTWSITANGSTIYSPVAALGKNAITSRFEPGLGIEPWFSNGTGGGAVLLGDLAPGANNSDPEFLSVLGDRCFFLANLNREIWVTDGTPAGTRVFFDLPGTSDHYGYMRTVGDRLFFEGYDTTHGTELWVSDGTVAGTHVVLDSVPGGGGASIRPYGSIGSVLVYRVFASTGRALWRSDGTAAGTYFLTAGEPQSTFVSDGRYGWFALADAANGNELWRTDGTAAGTGLFADLLPGPASGNPSDFAVSGGRLLLQAQHPVLGIEPWVMDLGASVQRVGEACFTIGTAPRLDATPPVLGTTMTVRGSNGPPVGFAVTMFAFPTTGSFRLPGGHCDLFLAQPFEVLQFSILAAGGFTLGLSLPGDPGFTGLQLRLQSLLFPGGIAGAEATPAVQLGFGM
jgi:ELWxxDGT repeat protein